MTSPLFALFTRSVREDTRAKSTYWARAGLAAFMVVNMGIAVLARFVGGAPGLVFLQNAAWLQAVFLTISALGYFASAITEEKEEETLGLLRMTNLSPLAVLLGKSTSRLCGALLLVVAQLPFTLLAVTLGGVSSGQVFAAYATLAAYAFFLCNLAVLASVIAPRTGFAALGTGAVLLASWMGGKFWPPLAAMSPFRRLDEIFSTGFLGSPVGWQVGSNLVVGLLCFLAAWGCFEHLCAGRTESRPVGGTFLQRRFRGWFAPGRPDALAAVAWKDFHFIHGGRLAQIAKTAISAVVVLGLIAVEMWHGRNAWQTVPSKVFYLSLLWLVAEAGFAASRIYACELHDRTLSSLALLPQSLPVTLSEKVAPCWRALLPGRTLFCICVLCAILHAFGGKAELLMLIVGGGIGGAYVGTMSFLGVYLTGYLSLRMKHGALPLAVIICLGVGLLLMVPLLGWFGVPIIAVVVGLRLRSKILLRLEDLAAES